MFVSPVPLLHATTLAAPLSPQALLASAGADDYLRLGSSQHAGRAHLLPDQRDAPLERRGALAAPTGAVSLSFQTSSPVLLGEVLRAAAARNGQITNVSLAFRTPGSHARQPTKLIDTFTAARSSTR